MAGLYMPPLLKKLLSILVESLSAKGKTCSFLVLVNTQSSYSGNNGSRGERRGQRSSPHNCLEAKNITEETKRYEFVESVPFMMVCKRITNSTNAPHSGFILLYGRTCLKKEKEIRVDGESLNHPRPQRGRNGCVTAAAAHGLLCYLSFRDVKFVPPSPSARAALNIAADTFTHTTVIYIESCSCTLS